MTADFIIVSKPVSIQFECPYCHCETTSDGVILFRQITGVTVGMTLNAKSAEK